MTGMDKIRYWLIRRLARNRTVILNGVFHGGIPFGAFRSALIDGNVVTGCSITSEGNRP